MTLHESFAGQYRRDTKGRLIRLTKEGRVRKNWKVQYRKASLKFLKKHCEHCHSSDQLTIHHKIPLRENVIVTKENCITLCRKCHDIEEQSKTM